MAPRSIRRSATKNLGPPDLRVAALLARIGRTGSLRKAARALGIAPSNAHRILRNEASRLGVQLLAGSRGGLNGGGSRLTSEGRALSRFGRGVDVAPVTWWACRVVNSPTRNSPWLVEVPGAHVTALVAPIHVTHPEKWTRRSGSDLELGIVPEAVTILADRTPPRGSAQNLWTARLVRFQNKTRFGVQYVELAVGANFLIVSVTMPAISQLRLRVGSKVLLQVKATALRLREPTR